MNKSTLGTSILVIAGVISALGIYLVPGRQALEFEAPSMVLGREPSSADVRSCFKRPPFVLNQTQGSITLIEGVQEYDWRYALGFKETNHCFMDHQVRCLNDQRDQVWKLLQDKRMSQLFGGLHIRTVEMTLFDNAPELGGTREHFDAKVVSKISSLGQVRLTNEFAHSSKEPKLTGERVFHLRFSLNSQGYEGGGCQIVSAQELGKAFEDVALDRVQRDLSSKITQLEEGAHYPVAPGFKATWQQRLLAWVRNFTP